MREIKGINIDSSCGVREKRKVTVTSKPKNKVFVFQNFSDNLIFGEFCTFINCHFGKNCTFGNSCRFVGLGNIFADKCRFGNRAVFLDSNRFGNQCRFGPRAKFYGSPKFGSKCIFGDSCDFGNCCSKFEIDCEFGDYCIFGGGSSFQDGCTFGNCCKIRSSVDAGADISEELKSVKDNQSIIGLCSFHGFYAVINSP